MGLFGKNYNKILSDLESHISDLCNLIDLNNPKDNWNDIRKIYAKANNIWGDLHKSDLNRKYVFKSKKEFAAFLHEIDYHLKHNVPFTVNIYRLGKKITFFFIPNPFKED